MNKMDNISLLHDFVDGQLPAEMEDKLFHAMSANPELRSELKRYIEFESMPKFDAEAFTPRPESTGNIFAALGIENTSGNVVAAGSFWNRLGLMLGKYSNTIISSAASALISGIVVFLLMNSGTGSSGHEEYASDYYNYPPSDFEDGNSKGNNIPVIVSSDNIENDQSEKQAADPKIIIKYVDRPIDVDEYYRKYGAPILSEVSDKNENSYESDNNPIILASNQRPGLSEPERNTGYPSQGILPAGRTISYRPLSLDAGSGVPIGLALEFRGSEYWNFPGETVNQSTNPIFNNSGLTLFYDLGNNFEIGLDVRQEYFYQNFRGYEDTLFYAYEQNTNYISGGLLLKYSLPLYQNIISAFAQTGLSVNKAGPVGRFMIGFNYWPSRAYGFTAGLEGSYLQYRNDGNSYSSKKLGLHYGVIFKF